MNVSTIVTHKVEQMKQRILTNLEKGEIKSFLGGKKSSTIIRMLKYRAKKFLPIIREDIRLLEMLLEKKE
jgi:hypothetical protein